MYKVFLIYLAVVNIITIILFALDKVYAVKNKRRITEKSLIAFSFIGGAYFALISMYLFRHKTNKTKFIILIPLSVLLWTVLIMYLLNEGILI